jgi:hypothetical protein
MSWCAPIFTPERVVRLLAATMVVLAIAASALAGVAAAGSWGGSLPPLTWTTGNGAYYYMTYMAAEARSGPPEICVGPVQASGGKVIFPYGWKCGSVLAQWEFPGITAAHGVDNPNSRGEQLFAAFFS